MTLYVKKKKKNIAGNMEVSETVTAAAATAALRAIDSTQP